MREDFCTGVNRLNYFSFLCRLVADAENMAAVFGQAGNVVNFRIKYGLNGEGNGWVSDGRGRTTQFAFEIDRKKTVRQLRKGKRFCANHFVTLVFITNNNDSLLCYAWGTVILCTMTESTGTQNFISSKQASTFKHFPFQNLQGHLHRIMFQFCFL
jgi:hypothetical protein